jgi:hypothetical protein
MDDIQIGIETFSPVINKVLNKGVPIIKYVELMKWCDELGIHLTYNLIVRSPWETQADVDEAVQNMQQLLYFAPPRLCPFKVSYGSTIYQEPERFNIKRIYPSAELEWMPPELQESLGILISNHAGYEFDPAIPAEVDYSQFERVVDDWREAREIGTTLRGRIGPGFLDLVVRAGDLYRTIRLEGSQAEIYLSCAVTARSMDVLTRTFPELKESHLLVTLERLIALGIMFRESGKYLSLASFNEERLLAAARKPVGSRQLPVAQIFEGP